MTAFVRYINSALEELRHVRWPTRQQAVRFSGIVIAFTAVCAVIFGVIDYMLTILLEYLISLV